MPAVLYVHVMHHLAVECTHCTLCTVIEDRSNGIFVCTECGTVQNDFTSHEEWTNHNNYEYDDFRVREIASPSPMLSAKSAQVNLFDEFEICTDYITQPVQGLAIQYFTMSMCKCMTRGVNRRALFVCCVYHAFSAMGIPRSLKELSNQMSINRTTLTKANKLLGITVPDIHKDTMNISISSSTQLISRMCECVMIEDDITRQNVRKLSFQIDQHLIDMQHSIIKEMTSISVASGIVTYACIEYEVGTKISISRLLNISSITIDKIINCIRM
jgi:transcription initiation factor TFIIIB Brf1 subunit/transcription initiation factor TFIIB